MNNLILQKYHGLGNDFLILDPNKTDVILQERKVEQICRRNFGVGADGIIYGPVFYNKPDGTRGIEVEIFNADGTRVQMCGNGIRIFAKYLLDEGYIDDKEVGITIDNTEIKVEALDDDGASMKANMGKADFDIDSIPMIADKKEVINENICFKDHSYKVTCLSVGNPHCVMLSDEISSKEVKELGPFVESAEYFPEHVNMQIMQIEDRNNIHIEIYERGVGYTLSSGTSACAAVAAAYKNGLVDKKVYVHMAGGKLLVEIDDDDNLLITGPVDRIGVFTLAEDFFS